MVVLWLVLGLVMLIAGAEVLIRASVRLAGLFGVPSVVVGLTVVAYGTSAPELFFSFQSALAGRAEMAAANVIGSNVFNVLMILGISSVVFPLTIHQELIRKDVPVLVVLSFLVWFLCLDGSFGLTEGVILLIGLIIYTVAAVVAGNREADEFQAEYREAAEGFKRYLAGYTDNLFVLVVGIVIGVLMLMQGSGWFAGAASALARQWGVSEWVIGATIVATGTSLPEIITSLMATLKGQEDVAVANVVGSNIFNLLGILAGSAVLSGGLPIGDAVIGFDLPFMVVAALVCLPFFITDFRLSRFEGAWFALYFLLYVYLLLNPSTLSSFSAPVRMFIVLGPLLLVTTGMVVWSGFSVRTNDR